ncbi:MAG: thioredoxin family protein [Acidaminococcus sp.]|jgi:thioredoxin 1|nr:thioredoxin family protein [Acidaminococcus sp.]MCI2100979.1 thioredoxin family protein [Acidaminococcus sp.]MCI2115322.1 thioredoxin family protein [Acidaminococcus sp.]MCI2117390.1 thioredoxin family protein [Acidaminococcus sp.]
MYTVLSGAWKLPQLIADNDCLVIQFGTQTCSPCRAIASKLQMWSRKHPEFNVVYVPMEKHLQQSVQMGVLSAPTLLTYIDGQLTRRECGYFSLERALSKTEKLMKFRNG